MLTSHQDRMDLIASIDAALSGVNMMIDELNWVYAGEGWSCSLRTRGQYPARHRHARNLHAGIGTNGRRNRYVECPSARAGHAGGVH